MSTIGKGIGSKLIWLVCALMAGLIAVVLWLKPELIFTPENGPAAESVSLPLNEEPKSVKIGETARANLGVVSRPALPQSHWKTIEIPGIIIDRPGVTDSGVTTPIDGVISQVHAIEGDIVHPDQKLFTIRLISDYLQKAQLELFQAVRETELQNQEILRLSGLVDSGAVPGKRIIELKQNVQRQMNLVAGQRQDLVSRGIHQEQIEQIERGEFLTSIEIRAPKQSPAKSQEGDAAVTDQMQPHSMEIQKLNVSLGEQVNAGEVLAILANHNWLYIKGNAFKKEASNLARAAENSWPVQVDFSENSENDWPRFDQVLHIRHLANASDPNSRTFDFFVPLTNQSRVYEKENRSFVVWRFRPGQRVRIQVPIEELKNVFVLPTEAVVFEGAEAYVFQQNGDYFNRLAVQVLHQDRSQVVIANDGSVAAGFFLVQSSASSFNRILKTQSAAGQGTVGSHTHADGTTHGAH